MKDYKEISVENVPENVPYVVYESAMARAEKRLKLVVMLWFFSLVLAGFGFFWYLTLPVEETYENVTQSTDKGGNNQMIGGDFNGNTDKNEADDP